MKDQLNKHHRRLGYLKSRHQEILYNLRSIVVCYTTKFKFYFNILEFYFYYSFQAFQK